MIGSTSLFNSANSEEIQNVKRSQVMLETKFDSVGNVASNFALPVGASYDL